MRSPRLIALFAILLILTVIACKKYNFNGVVSPASVTVVHAMPAGNSIEPFFGVPPAQYWKTRQQVWYGGSYLFSPPKDSNALLVVPSTDTAFHIFQGKMPLVSGGIYTFFLAGDTTQPDTLFLKDEIPYYQDSAVACRFVNCSQGGKSLNVYLQGNTQAEISNMGYMRYGSFKRYAADNSVGGAYNFIITDAASGDTLTTYTWYYTVYKTNDLVIMGSQDGTGPQPLQVFAINYF
jgi:hypothetical protein